MEVRLSRASDLWGSFKLPLLESKADGVFANKILDQ